MLSPRGWDRRASSHPRHAPRNRSQPYRSCTGRHHEGSGMFPARPHDRHAATCSCRCPRAAHGCGSTQRARIMIYGHRRTSHKAKAPLAGWCDDAGVSRLRHSDYGRIIFCGYVRIRTTPRERERRVRGTVAFAILSQQEFQYERRPPSHQGSLFVGRRLPREPQQKPGARPGFSSFECRSWPWPPPPVPWPGVVVRAYDGEDTIPHPRF
jgi:hypothetical protein